eukprot:1159932-Pelagomonas_calceolata.AAC.5
MERKDPGGWQASRHEMRGKRAVFDRHAKHVQHIPTLHGTQVNRSPSCRYCLVGCINCRVKSAAP